MALDTAAIIDAVASHALALGRFERVNQHEPANSPISGLTAAVWVDRLGPARASSGLATTSARLVLQVRIYSSVAQEPADAIDPTMLAAVDALMGAYSADFTLGGLVRSVDLLGEEGQVLDAQAGYLELVDAVYRVFTITVPIIANDTWEQHE